MNVLYSFDIFDTCLGRICGKPKNIFDILAVEVLGDNACASLVNDFRYIRVSGEVAARRTSRKADITLSEIYDKCDFTSVTGIPKEIILKKELDVEGRNLFAIKSTLDIINKLHEKNHYVVYISDMYLPSSFIIGVLKREGFWMEGDKIYLSCEYNATKSRGSLFDIVRRQEKPFWGCWLHRGDNIRSDFLIPWLKGIRAKWTKTQYSEYENYLCNLNFNPSYRTNSIAAGISRYIRLINKKDPRISFAADLIAPIYVTFVYGIMKDATEKGINDIYFLARDGYVFFQIAQVFRESFPKVGIHYIYASRKSLYLPAINQISENTIRELLLENRSLKESIDNLQIELSEEEFNFLKGVSDLPKAILQNNSIRKKLECHWAEQKELILRYFKQEGLACTTKKTAIVDLRGSRKSQQCINEILRGAGYPETYGYYLEVTDYRIRTSANYFSVFYRDNIGESPLYLGLKESMYVLEHYYSITPFARTSHYCYDASQREVTPVYDKYEMINSISEQICKTNIDVCVLFAKKMLLYHQKNEYRQILLSGLALLSSFMNNPSRFYLKALLDVNMSQTQFKTRFLVDYVGLYSMLRKKIIWYEGSIMLTYGKVGFWLYNTIGKKCVKILIKK